jgi:hypothetical protein
MNWLAVAAVVVAVLALYLWSITELFAVNILVSFISFIIIKIKIYNIYENLLVTLNGARKAETCSRVSGRGLCDP